MTKIRLVNILLLVSFCFNSYSQKTDILFQISRFDGKETLNPLMRKEANDIIKNQNKNFGIKLLQGSALVFGYEGIALAILYASPNSFSNWQRPTPHTFKTNLKNAFTKPPVYDKDKWFINYLGHPYQGACTFNALRSQGATFWQSGLFTIGHSFFWEYVIEAGNEQPSMQDILITPLCGIVLGELSHHATMAMYKGGIKWYEGIVVTIINPMFVINNGYGKRHLLKKP